MRLNLSVQKSINRHILQGFTIVFRSRNRLGTFQIVSLKIKRFLLIFELLLSFVRRSLCSRLRRIQNKQQRRNLSSCHGNRLSALLHCLAVVVLCGQGINRMPQEVEHLQIHRDDTDYNYIKCLNSL